MFILFIVIGLQGKVFLQNVPFLTTTLHSLPVSKVTSELSLRGRGTLKSVYNMFHIRG